MILYYAKLKRVREIKPCVKRYLANHIKSNFRKIDATEFIVAALLPVQRFVKKGEGHIWAQSRGMI